MASVAAADRTPANMEVLEETALNAAPLFPFDVNQKNGFFQVADMPVVGGLGVQVVFTAGVDDGLRQDGKRNRVLLWFTDDLGATCVVTPSYIKRYGDGLDNHATDTAIGLPVIDLVQGRTYKMTINYDSQDTITVIFHDINGGEPLSTLSLTVTGMIGTGAYLFAGYPTSDMLNAHFNTTINLLPATDSKFISTGVANAGPTGCEFTQETTLSNADNLPAGTYVGYFTPAHATESVLHVYSDMGEPYDSEFEILNNKLYTKISGAGLTIVDMTVDCIVKDLFKNWDYFTTTGHLVVTA